MNKRDKKLKNKEEAVQASPVFDTALPVDLLHKGIKSEPEKEVKIRVGENARLSPYIIKLTREGEKISNLDLAELDQKILCAQIANEAEECLSFDFSDLVAQVEEDRPIEFNISEEELGKDESDLITFDEISAELGEENEVNEEEVEALNEEIEVEEAYIRWNLPSMPVIGNVKIKIIASFVGLSLLLAGPIQAMNEYAGLQGTAEKLANSSNMAVNYLQNANGALQAQDFNMASSEFMSAEQTFGDLAKELRTALRGIASVATLIPQTNRTIRSVESLIEAGAHLSKAAEKLTDAVQTLEDAPHLKITDKIGIFATYAEAIQPHLSRAEAELSKVDVSIIPEDRLEVVENLIRTVPALRGSFDLYLEHIEAIQTILGADVKRRYLLVFQNTAEIRATGGFAGSYAEIDIDRGEITNVHVPPGGTYDVQGQLRKFISSPPPMHLIKPRWEFQDANWYPDFPLSAKQFLKLHESAGGPTVDGVIAINSTVLPKLLEITGPIELEEYGRTFTAENVLFELQKIVEIEYSELRNLEDREEDAPKLIIGDMMAEVMNRMQEMELMDALQIFDLLLQKLNHKEAFVFFSNNEVQAQMNRLNWTGVQQKARMDELQIINTNIGGGKTDTVIDQDVDLLVQILPDGRIVNTVTYTKRHRGLRTGIFEGVNNVDYVRFYVPRGSKLLQATGFDKIPPDSLFKTSEVELEMDETYSLVTRYIGQHEESGTDIFEENGKTVFGNWMQIMPGEVEQVVLQYELPFRLNEGRPDNLLNNIINRLGIRDIEEYELLIQKQSGIQRRDTRVVIEHVNWNKVWSSHGGTYELDNANDHLIQILMERK